MKQTILSKTLTASLSGETQTVYAWISDPLNLSAWHSSFCRSVRLANGAFIVESPSGPVKVRFVREDRALVLDILVQVSDGLELTNAIRLLSNGEGTEMVWTLVKPSGLPDSVFHQHLRWAASALQALRKTPLSTPLESPLEPVLNASTLAEEAEPLQVPSATETREMPLSGKKLFIGNLSYAWTDEELRAHCAESGTVVTAEVARFRGRGGRSRGFGFVEMATEEEAQTAITKLHGGTAGGRVIIVRLAKSQESRPVASASAPEPQVPAARRTSGRGASRQRPDRPRRGGRPSPTGPRRDYPSQDIQNNHGYEIFPRGSPAQSQPDRPSSSAPARPNREASPYMDDTGDIENHGRRPPHRGRGR